METKRQLTKILVGKCLKFLRITPAIWWPSALTFMTWSLRFRLESTMTPRSRVQGTELIKAPLIRYSTALGLPMYRPTSLSSFKGSCYSDAQVVTCVTLPRNLLGSLAQSTWGHRRIVPFQPPARDSHLNPKKKKRNMNGPATNNFEAFVRFKVRAGSTLDIWASYQRRSLYYENTET